MPRTPDASSVTRFKRVSTNTVSGPSARSRSFEAPTQPGLLSSLVRTSDEGRQITPTRSFLMAPTWKAPQRALTRYLTGGGCVTEARRYRAVVGITTLTEDPTNGGFGFAQVGGLLYVIISKIDENSRDASNFVSSLSTASTIQFSNTDRPTERVLRPVGYTDSGTFSVIQFTIVSANGTFSPSDIFNITKNC